MNYIILLLSTTLVVAQENDFLNDFLKNYEEVTPPPLGSLQALSKCGEGPQTDLFVCVPYYNCDANTNTVIQNPETDGSNRIDIRMRAGDDNFKCDHYLEVCCQLPTNETTNDEIPPSATTQTPPRVSSSTTASSVPSNRTFCGIRNTEGLDFNIIERGNEALFGEFPWMVAILRMNPLPGQALAICGGSLITPKVVLTGAHCVYNLDVGEIKIRAGEWDTQTQNERLPYQERNVIQKILRKDFNNQNLYNDVALLILDRSLVKIDNVGTICLPTQGQVLQSTNCLATGWGKDSFGAEGRYAVIPKKIELPLVNRETCQRALRKTRLTNSFVLHTSFTCAGGEKGKDTCTGDGGSPLICPDPKNPGRYLQAGIVAWGIGCGATEIPGVYVDVTRFRQWIDDSLQELGIRSVSYQ